MIYSTCSQAHWASHAVGGELKPKALAPAEPGVEGVPCPLASQADKQGALIPVWWRAVEGLLLPRRTMWDQTVVVYLGCPCLPQQPRSLAASSHSHSNPGLSLGCLRSVIILDVAEVFLRSLSHGTGSTYSSLQQWPEQSRISLAGGERSRFASGLTPGWMAREMGELCTETHRNLLMENLQLPETPGSSQIPWKWKQLLHSFRAFFMFICKALCDRWVNINPIPQRAEADRGVQKQTAK